jgi:hypothetical protein
MRTFCGSKHGLGMYFICIYLLILGTLEAQLEIPAIQTAARGAVWFLVALLLLDC